MSLSSAALHTATLASEAEGAPAINPYVVGAIALLILLAMLIALMMFGGGREHS